MKDRLKTLRSELNLTQQAFADRIGVKRNTVATYEMGRNEPTDPVIKIICSTFHVREEWLRTGDGGMFRQTDPDDEIQQLVDGLLASDDLKRRLCTAIVKLDSKQLNAAVEWIRETFAVPDAPAASDAADRERTIDEKVADYRAELEAEEAARRSEASLTGNGDADADAG